MRYMYDFHLQSFGPAPVKSRKLSAHGSPLLSGFNRQGSVLLVSLLMISLLLMIVLALSGMVTLELRRSVVHQDQVLARQNARLALNLALAALQEHSGPDQRVTAASALVIDDGDSAGLHKINRHWTGVWRNGNRNPFNPQDPVASQMIPERLAWLVSSPPEEAEPSPLEDITDLQTHTPPSRVVNRQMMLMSPGSSSSGALTLERAVTAPRVLIPSGKEGHYAWWVGDEGIKARANLIDPYAEPGSPLEALRRLASAQRPALEALTAFSPYYEANLPMLALIRHLTEFAFLHPSAEYQTALQAAIHDVTLHSRSVLSDTRHGGLKRDLSYILGQATPSDLQDALQAVYADKDVITHTDFNRILTPEVTPLLEFPPADYYTYASNIPHPDILRYTATWEQLWSFHNTGNTPSDHPPGITSPAGEVLPQRHTPTQHGVHPICVQAKLFYRLEVDVNGFISIGIKPLVVLANPYAVPLAPGEYTFRFVGVSRLEVRYGELAPDEEGNEPDTVTFPEANRLLQLSGGGLQEVSLTVQSQGIPPGEALVFTLAQDGIQIPDSSQDQQNLSVPLVNDFDPGAWLVYPTGIRLPGNPDPDPVTGVQRQPYAALCMPGQGLSRVRMYMDAIPGSQAGLIHDVQIIKNYSEEASGGVAYDFLVFPTRSSREGGGLAFTLFDAGAKSSHTHSLFYQQNYRTNYINGYHSAGTDDAHLVEWARAHKKKGSPGNEEYFKAHLAGLTDSGFTSPHIRWGALNTGDPNSSYETVALAGLGDRVGFVNLLYDLPRPGVPLASLGQLQHFNVNSFIEASAANNPDKSITVQSWQMNYSLSNSYANPRVLRDRLMDSIYSGFHYDGSYIWNRILWDRFYFSTFPYDEDFDFSTDLLVNARYRPYRNPPEAATAIRGNGDPQNQANSRLAAGHLLVDGGFNINSTSREAWKAQFASLRGVQAGSESHPSAPYVRTLMRLAGSESAKTANHENAWSGFRDLTEAELDALAEEMVRQVRLRGPFLSMSDFVNRRLIPKSGDTHGLGLKGALQSAIDSAVNNKYAVHLRLRPPMTTHPNRNPDPELASTTLMDGFPGYLLQGDVLSALGPHLTARSDTFRIRAYGDVSKEGSEIQAQAWCEAVVQRIPGYVDPVDAPQEDPSSVLNVTFGRRYEIISFRWLMPAEL